MLITSEALALLHQFQVHRKAASNYGARSCKTLGDISRDLGLPAIPEVTYRRHSAQESVRYPGEVFIHEGKAWMALFGLKISGLVSYTKVYAVDSDLRLSPESITADETREARLGQLRLTPGAANTIVPGPYYDARYLSRLFMKLQSGVI